MSRGHPGQSAVYRQKLLTRMKREEERGFLLEAKKVFSERNPDQDPRQNRSKVTQIKKELMGEASR